MMDIKTVITAAGDAAQLERKAARMAWEDAVRQIFQLEKHFLQAFDGARLRGLPNLGNGEDAYFGINVRKKSPGDLLKDPTRNPDCIGEDVGPEALCINKEGQLVMARMTQEDLEERPVESRDLQSSDLRSVSSSYLIAAKLHLAKCAKDEERWAGVTRLAQEIEATLSRN